MGRLESTAKSIVQSLTNPVGMGAYFQPKGVIGKAKMGSFPLSLNVWIANWGRNTKVDTLVAAPHALHPGIFTGNPLRFEQSIRLSKDGLAANVGVKIVSEEW